MLPGFGVVSVVMLPVGAIVVVGELVGSKVVGLAVGTGPSTLYKIDEPLIVCEQPLPGEQQPKVRKCMLQRKNIVSRIMMWTTKVR